MDNQSSDSEIYTEYNEKELLSRNFLFEIVGILYQLELEKVIEKAYEYKSARHKQKWDKLIVLAPKILEFLKLVIHIRISL